MLKLCQRLGVFGKSVVFLGLTFSIHVLQYEERVFKQFSNPVLDLVGYQISAYNSVVPFGRTNGSDSVFSNKYGKLFIVEVK